MKKIILVLIIAILGVNTVLFSQSMPVFWQIGERDKSAAEFVLGPSDYTSFPQRFKNRTIVYEIGKSKPQTDFPFALPGPSDNWSGFISRQIVIRFGIKDIPKDCPARFEMNYLDVRTSPPVLEITINDYKTEIQVPPGNDLYFGPNREVNPANLSTVVDIPGNVLKKGNNTILINSKSGNWVVFDNVSLSTACQLQPDKTTDETSIISAEVIQGLIYGKNKELRQPVILQVSNFGKPKVVDVLIDGKFLEKIRLDNGINRIETNVPEVTTETEAAIALAQNSKIMAQTTVKATPVKPWTVYLVQHTHTDIGYTKPQTEILAEHIRYIDYAIEYCELTDTYPDDAKFRWTCETAWAVKEYLQNRPKEQIEKFLKYVKEGRIEITGMFFNMAEIVDENSLKTFLEPIREFKKLGIPVTTAMQNDVNGIAWCLADYLPDLGVKYFTMGENGHRALIPFDRPTVYKWESPSGKQMYSFRSDHYMTGNSLGINRGSVEAMAPNVIRYLESLKNRNYPFDAISVQYQGYQTDNSPPSMLQCDLIRAWNEKYATPKLRSAVFREFMDYITDKYAGQLPVYRVAYPDWWTDGFGSAARETAAARKTHADMITIQGLLSMAVLKEKTLSPYVPDKIRHVHENLLFYDEHTYGAAESIRDPMSENSMVQWAEKASYAWEALKTAQIMYETSIGLLQGDINRGKYPTITFYNTLNWKRSGVVEIYIDHEIIPQNRQFKIVDETGKELKTQALRSRSEGTYYAILTEDLPPLGYNTYRIITEKDDRPALPATSMNNNTIENEYYKLIFDSQKGSIKSLFDKKLQLEMVDSGSEWQLGALVYETLLGNRRQMERYTMTEYNRTGLKDVKLMAGTNGPIYQSILIEGKSGCCDDKFGVKIEIRLFHHEKRIELNYAIRKTPVTDPDGIYVAFPFQLNKAKLYFDVQGGVVSSGENQMEGTATDWNTVQNFVTARNDKAQFIVGSNQIPLFQLGGIRTGLYQRKKTYELPHVYSWVTNNYWTTNFRASQEGELRWSYYLTSSDDLSNTVATRFGWGSRVPIYARVMPEGKVNNMPMSYSPFTFSRDNLLMTSTTPSIETGYILINVRELDGKQTPLQIIGNNGKILEFSVVNAIEEPIQSGLKEINFAPFENKFIKLKL